MRGAPNGLLTLLWHLVIVSACQVSRPQAGKTSEQPSFEHAKFVQTACTECHEKDRPEAFLTVPHGGGKNCEQCHVSKDEKNDLTHWLPRRSYSHKPDPTACFDCHIKERPDTKTHPKTGECVGCHKHGPIWKPI